MHRKNSRVPRFCLRDQMVIPLLLEHKMHMRRPPRMSLQLQQQLAHWSIMRNRIRHWHNRLKPENAVLVTAHDASTIWAVVVSVLDVVVACGVGLPDVDLAPFDRLAGRIREGADDETGFAFGVGRDGGAIWKVLGFVSVEWTQNGAFSAIAWLWMVNRVD